MTNTLEGFLLSNFQQQYVQCALPPKQQLKTSAQTAVNLRLPPPPLDGVETCPAPAADHLHQRQRGPHQRGPWPGNQKRRTHHMKHILGNLVSSLSQGWHFLVSGLTRQELGLGPTRGPRQIIGSRCCHHFADCMSVSNTGCRAT